MMEKQIICPCCQSEGVLNTCGEWQICCTCKAVFDNARRKPDPLAEAMAEKVEKLLMPVNKITAPWRHRGDANLDAMNLDKLSNRQIDVEEAIKAYRKGDK